jgi:hypothetical protein
LVQAIAELDAALDQSRLLPERLRRRLLVLSLLIAYLEDRGVLDPQLFGQCTPGAARFFEVLADGPGLVRLLTDLERRFNGDVFCMSEDEQAKLIASRQLARFAELVEGRTSAGGQLSLWRLYSFRDLPVELISHVYQHFVRADRSAVYTPPFLVASCSTRPSAPPASTASKPPARPSSTRPAAPASSSPSPTSA